ncbi:hypothetical protein HUN03_00771 [Mycoplasmopsis anatis]|uniref:hypothetical protein n=1 Tax=Mycoplasmopsis anatis TaxID=171279 RepID=UPI003F83EF08
MKKQGIKKNIKKVLIPLDITLATSLAVLSSFSASTSSASNTLPQAEMFMYETHSFDPNDKNNKYVDIDNFYTIEDNYKSDSIRQVEWAKKDIINGSNFPSLKSRVKVNMIDDFSSISRPIRSGYDSHFWNNNKQKWAIEFNRGPVVPWKSGDENLWASNPRLGVVVSNDLKIVPGSIKITAYKPKSKTDRAANAGSGTSLRVDGAILDPYKHDESEWEKFRSLEILDGDPTKDHYESSIGEKHINRYYNWSWKSDNVDLTASDGRKLFRNIRYWSSLDNSSTYEEDKRKRFQEIFADEMYIMYYNDMKLWNENDSYSAEGKMITDHIGSAFYIKTDTPSSDRETKYVIEFETVPNEKASFLNQETKSYVAGLYSAGRAADFWNSLRYYRAIDVQAAKRQLVRNVNLKVTEYDPFSTLTPQELEKYKDIINLFQLNKYRLPSIDYLFQKVDGTLLKRVTPNRSNVIEYANKELADSSILPKTTYSQKGNFSIQLTESVYNSANINAANDLKVKFVNPNDEKIWGYSITKNNSNQQYNNGNPEFTVRFNLKKEWLERQLQILKEKQDSENQELLNKIAKARNYADNILISLSTAKYLPISRKEYYYSEYNKIIEKLDLDSYKAMTKQEQTDLLRRITEIVELIKRYDNVYKYNDQYDYIEEKIKTVSSSLENQKKILSNLSGLSLQQKIQEYNKIIKNPLKSLAQEAKTLADNMVNSPSEFSQHLKTRVDHYDSSYAIKDDTEVGISNKNTIPENKQNNNYVESVENAYFNQSNSGTIQFHSLKNIEGLLKLKQDQINKILAELEINGNFDNQVKKLEEEIKKGLNVEKDKLLKQVDNLTNLSLAYRASLKEQMNKLAQIDNVESLGKINSLYETWKGINDIIGKLRDADLPKYEAVTKDKNYIFSELLYKTAFNQSLANAKSILELENRQYVLKNGISEEKVYEYITKLHDDFEALNGNKKVQEIKNELNAHLEANKNNLTTQQIQLFKDKINTIDSTTNINSLDSLVSTKNKLKSSIKETNDKMFEIKNNYNQLNDKKQSIDYKFSDSSIKKQFDEQLTKTNSDINSLNKELASTLNSPYNLPNSPNSSILNGQSFIDANKVKVSSLVNLSSAQKEQIKQKLETLADRNAVETLINNLASLDSKITELKSLVAKENEVKNSTACTSEPDRSKKTAYDNAIKEANSLLSSLNNDSNLSSTENVNGQITKVDNAISKIKTAQSSLTGAALANAKKDFENWINSTNPYSTVTHYLNNAQKSDFLTKNTNAKSVEEITQLKSQASSLDSVMKQLSDKVNELLNTKTTSKYLNSDSTKKTNFDKALEVAKALVDKSGELKNKTEVESILNNLVSTFDALDGEARLKQEKDKAIASINALDSLNNNQKSALISEVNSKSLISELSPITVKATNLNTSMKDLNSAIKSAELLKSKPENEWKYGDNNLKDIVDSELNRAKALANKTTGENKNQSEVTQLINNLTSAIKNLKDKYTDDLNAAKAQAKVALSQAGSLPESVKTEFTNKINNEVSIESLKILSQNIHDLNNAVSELKKQSDKAEQVKKTDLYNNAQPQNKTLFDNAFSKAQNVLNTLNSTPEQISKVQEITRELVAAMNRLDSANAELNAKKDAAKDEIGKLTNLNSNQKNSLKLKVENSNNEQEINSVVSEAKELDSKMAELKKLVERANLELPKVNYLESDNKNQFDIALQNANNILNNLINDFKLQDIPSVSNAITNLTTELNNLNGVQVLKRLKDDLKNKVNNEYTSLNNKQSSNFLEEIENATSRKAISDIDEKINTWNNSMKELQDTLDKANNTKETINYKNSTPEVKNEFDELARTASLTTDKNVANEYIEKQKSLSEIQELNNKLKNALNNLNGDKLLQDEKNKLLNDLLNNLNSLNNSQKESLKNEIQGANSVDELTNIAQRANELNEVMKKANKEAFEDIDKFKKTDKYSEKSQDKRSEFDSVVQEIQNALKNQNLNKEQVEELLDKLQQAKDKFNQSDDFDDAKNKFINDLDTEKYQNLIKSQKDKLKQLAKDSQTLDQLNDLINNNAKPLNQLMGELKDLNNKSSHVKTTVDYIEASVNLKDEFDKTLNESQRISQENFTPLNVQDEYIYNPEKVQELVEKLRNDLSVLDGLDKYQNNAIDQINSLEHINNSQKNYLINEVRNKETKEELLNIVEQANELDKSMEKLISAIDKSNHEKETSNYKNASISVKEEFDNILKQAKEVAITNSDINADRMQVDKLISDLEKSLANLNGDRTLNNKLEELRKYIDEKDKITVSDRFTKSPQEAQNKYLELIDKAKDLINDPEVTVEKINQLIEQIERAKNDLVDPKGHYTAADKNFIDDLQNINRNEKNFFKEQIEIAPDRETVELIKNEAVKLDNKKAGAKDIIENLNNLNNSEKEHFKNLVDQHTSVLSIPLTEAQLKEIDEIVLQAQKQDLINKIKNNPLLNDKEKEYYLDKVESVKDKDEFEKVKQLVDSVINKKQTAADEINNLPNLNVSEKDKFIEKIKDTDLLPDQNNNINSAEIDKIVEKAKEINNKKQEVIDLINSKENLNDKEKENLINQVKDRDLSQIEDLEHSLDDIINSANKIDQIKKEAKDKIDNLENLDKTQKDELKDKIHNIVVDPSDPDSYIDPVNKIVENANKVDQIMKDIIDELSKDNSTEESAKIIDPLIDELDKLEIDTTLVNNIINLSRDAEKLDKLLELFKNSDAHDSENTQLNKNNLKEFLPSVQEKLNKNIQSSIPGLSEYINKNKTKATELLNQSNDEINLNDFLVNPLTNNKENSIYNDLINQLISNNYQKLFDEKVEDNEKREIIDQIKAIDLNNSNYSNIAKSQLEKIIQDLETKLDESNSSRSLKILKIVGITLGSILTLGLLIFFILLLAKKRKKK